jgi:hypothetical protein
MKFGKLVPQHHPQTLRFGKYLEDGLLPDPATKVFREYKTPPQAKQMFGNDVYGCCVWALLANHLIVTSCHTGSVVIPTTEQVLEAYAAVTGFDPETGANDNGTVMTDALAYMQHTGLCGHKILGWARIDHTNLVHRRLAVDLFAAACTGVNFPASAMAQFSAGQPFELVKGSPIAAGHAMLHPGYGALGDDYVSWARWDQKAGAAWSFAYIDEEYIIITEDWFDQSTGKTAAGFDANALWADLKALRN